MRKETLYLDTSIASAYYDERAKERQETTIKSWNEVLPNHKVYISEITVQELGDTKDETLRKKLKELIKDFKVMKANKRTRELGRAYVKNRIFSEKYIDDSLHTAMVSWNYEHLVKVKRRRLVNSVNILEGYKEIEIVSPLELWGGESYGEDRIF